MSSLHLYAQKESTANQVLQKRETLFTMQKNQRWRELCALAAVEQDSEKLMALVAEITRLFDEEQAARNAKGGPNRPDEDPNASQEG
jgi:hypothetical protein